MRIALLSNVTVEVLAGMLKKEHSVWLPPGFGGWMETALNPGEDLVAFNPEAIYLLLDSHFCEVHGDIVVARDALSARFSNTAICVFDVARFSADWGSAFYDEKMWKLGKMPWSMKGLRELKKIFSLKKVLAVDLDNTVWDGVAGEDGPTGVRIRKDFQRELLELKNRGVLLTVLSKNNPEDVNWFFEKDDPFVAKGINWESKADNLIRIAKELNLGCDSFVFVDDNPAERAEMRARCPDVFVADFPPQLEAFFPKRELTAEDLKKTEQYQAEARRKQFAAGLSVEDYLKGLEIRTEIHPITQDEIPRVAQLSQKTNQFNVCTNRYSEDDIARFAQDSQHVLLTLHAGDRFGDQGLVAFVHASGDEIMDWVMSCRVMNRRIEFTMQQALEKVLLARGVKVLRATWKRTLKNAPVKDLFEKFGFKVVKETEEMKSYERVLGEDR